MNAQKIFAIFLTIILSSCSHTNHIKYEVKKVKFIKTDFNSMIGWKYDNHFTTLQAFSNSCKKFSQLNNSDPISKFTRIGGKARNWKVICRNLQDSNIKTNYQAQKFFEKWFVPYKVFDEEKNLDTGKITGYYEIEINGSLKKSKKCKYPVYSPPHNLQNHQNKKYLSHSSINGGSLRGKNLEILWVDNHARLYFMHIQGSGRIRLKDGNIIRLGYAGQNGFNYQSIGPYFKQYNAKGINSALDMIEWLYKNPGESRKIIEKNQSYIFFKKIAGDGPIGAQGVPLTPERSIAIDYSIYPYGTPIWVDSSIPKTKNYLSRNYRRLLIAQDTGGAIKGVIRGDIFFGYGDRAEELACHMNNQGKIYALFPRSVKVLNYYQSS